MKKFQSALLIAGLGLSILSPGIKAYAHGYVSSPGGRAYLGSSAHAGAPLNTNIGPVQYEPQSIEAAKNTFIDGKIPSAGLDKYSQLNEQTASRWYKTPVSSGPLKVAWHLTAPHRTLSWDYYMTKVGWDPNQPLDFSDFEKISTVDGQNLIPGSDSSNTINIPKDRTGYHVLLSVWNIADTGAAFYQVSDLLVGGEGTTPPVTDPIVEAPSLGGIVNQTLTVGDSFNPMSGVTATDKIDGDLTSKIKVTGSIDTEKAGSYTLHYSVTNSKGKTTEASRVITVNSKAVAEAPKFAGIKDLDLTVGEQFNPFAGVTATDKIDGDLTSEIKVTGTVDTSKAGHYMLDYSVTNSSGKTATASRMVMVYDKSTSTPEAEAWDATKIYLGGEKVSYKGNTYVAKWWTQNNAPDQSAAWEQVVEKNSDGSVPYQAGKAYNGGDIVKYNGMNYQAQWWTLSTPGSDSTWKMIPAAKAH